MRKSKSASCDCPFNERGMRNAECGVEIPKPGTICNRPGRLISAAPCEGGGALGACVKLDAIARCRRRTKHDELRPDHTGRIAVQHACERDRVYARGDG